ncbi:MAG: hypothetical protein PVG14_17115, partial [Anaerolineales bacterium]
RSGAAKRQRSDPQGTWSVPREAPLTTASPPRTGSRPRLQPLTFNVVISLILDAKRHRVTLSRGSDPIRPSATRAQGCWGKQEGAVKGEGAFLPPIAQSWHTSVRTYTTIGNPST